MDQKTIINKELSSHLRLFSYRPDLDGLRAVAIILVMIEHLFRGFGLVAGGLGVDMFFVLSGYLITQTVLKELAKGIFSFGHFYARRIRRLFPTVIVAFGVALIAGWWLLDAYGFRLLGGTVAASGLGIMNCVLSFGLPFFHIDPKLLPFGQLWSLGVEEQFYLIYPWLLVGMTRVSFLVKRRIPLLMLLACVSWAYHYTFRDIWGETYYNFLARYWGLLIGVILALSGDKISLRLLKVRAACQSLGMVFSLGMILLGSVFMGAEMDTMGINLWIGLAFFGFGLIFCAKKGDLPGRLIVNPSVRPVVGPGEIALGHNPAACPTNTVAMEAGAYLIVVALVTGVTVPLCFSAILATVGTALLIIAGPDGWINKKFLTQPIMVYIGKISYALYVIHYPLMVIWGLVDGHVIPDPGVLWFIFALSFPLAAFVYRFVEQPTRRAPPLWPWIALMLVCVAVGYAGYCQYINPRSHRDLLSQQES